MVTAGSHSVPAALYVAFVPSKILNALEHGHHHIHHHDTEWSELARVAVEAQTHGSSDHKIHMANNITS